MSTFTKILAFLNVLGILGLMYLASMAYGKRQAWAYSVYRHELMMNGLPLDQEEDNSRGRPDYLNLSEATLRELFPSSPVTSQQEEVDRVHQMLQGQINAVADRNQQTALLARFLTPLAITYQDREDLLSIEYYLRDAKTVAELKKHLNEAVAAARTLLELEAARPADAVRTKRKFDEAFSEMLFLHGGNPRRPFEAKVVAILAQNAAMPIDQAFDQAVTQINADLSAQLEQAFEKTRRDKLVVQGAQEEVSVTEQRRDATARLLLAMVDFQPQPGEQPGQAGPPAQILQSPAYLRVFNVVGLKSAIPAMEYRALVLGHFVDESRIDSSAGTTLSAELALQMGRERSRFLATHQALLAFLRTRAVHVDSQQKLLEYQKVQADKQEAVVMERQRDIKDAEDRIAEARAKTARRLEELQKMSQALYDIRIKTRDATRLNQQYYQDILKLERAQVNR